MRYKVCSKINCNKLIEINKRFCKEHEIEHQKRMQENNSFYARNRTDTKELAFYRSSDWNLLRQVVMGIYKGLCLYSYYVLGKIVKADAVHHIEEVKEAWGKRLEVDNLIPLSKAAHNKVHGAYSNARDKMLMQKQLKEFKVKFKNEFG